MEISESLLAALRCPQNGGKLAMAPAEILAALNARIAAGQVTDRDGRRLTAPLSSGLLRDDGALLYPVVDGFPILLIEEAIAVNRTIPT
jgi:uncharacterized protein YbaR (Trm112 family)